MSKLKTSFILFALILFITNIVAQVSPPFTIHGYLYQNDGVTPQGGANITLTHIVNEEQLYAASNEYGEFVFNLADLPSGYSAGDWIEITAEYDSLIDINQEIIGTESPQQVADLVLKPPIWNVTLVPNITQGGKEVQVMVSTVIGAKANATVNGITEWLTGLEDGNYTGIIIAPELDGNYSVIVTVEDPEGRKASGTVILVVDNTPPFLHIDQPENGSVTATGEQIVNGTTEPDATVTVNGANVTVINGTFTTTVNLSLGNNTITITATDPVGNVNLTEITVFYTLLYLSEIQLYSIQPGEILTISADVISPVPIEEVIAEITFPDNTTHEYLMVNVSETYYVDIVNLTVLGDYSVTVSATDIEGNKANRSAWFEVFRERSFYGDIMNAEDNALSTEFHLYKPFTDRLLKNFTTDSNGEYNVKVHKRNYDLLLEFSDMELTLENLNFTAIDNDPIDIDIVEKEVFIPNANPVIGFGVKIKGNLTSTSYVTVEYSQIEVNSEELLELYSCSDWIYENRTCLSDWLRLESVVDKISNTVSADITELAGAYMAAESSKCGNDICELNYGESCDTCPLDCGVCPTGGEVISGGAGRTSVDTSDLEAMIRTQLERIEELKLLLNETMTKGLDTTPITNQIGDQTKKIDEMRNLLKEIKEGMPSREAVSVTPGMQIVSVDLYPGESMRTSIRVRNVLNVTSPLTVNVTGTLSKIITIENPRMILEPGEESELRIIIHIPKDFMPGAYSGGIIGKLGENSIPFEVPINIRVRAPTEELLRLEIKPLTDTVEPGQSIKVQVNIYNRGEIKRNVNLSLQLIDVNTEDIITTTDDSIQVEKTVSITKNLTVPQDAIEGQYILKGTATYLGMMNRTKTVDDLTYITVRRSFFQLTLFGIPLWLFLLASFLVAAAFGAFIIYKKREAMKKRYLEMVDFKNLPQPGPRSGFVGKIAETDIRTFLNVDDLQIHTLVAGATGSGKTVASKVLVEEALKKNASVIVFDPTAQWSGFLRENKDRGMFRLYNIFGMKKDEARAFNGNVYTITDPLKRIDIKNYIKPGEITIFSIHKLDPRKIDILVANTITEIFQANLEESKGLKTVIVYDEVHRLLAKFGGSGEGFKAIERAVREFRKWGVGLILISQVLSDFVGEIKANIGTEIQMRTRYEGDLKRIKMKYGADILKSIVRASVGTGMIQNAQYNRGRPYFASFRPLLHDHSRLSDNELELYDRYNSEVEKLRDKLEAIKLSGVDIFDLEIELKLALDNIRKGAFDVVALYLESLTPRIDTEYKKVGWDIRRKVMKEKGEKKLGDYLKWKEKAEEPATSIFGEEARRKRLEKEEPERRPEKEPERRPEKEEKIETKFEGKATEFDTTIVENSTLDDIDEEKVNEFLKRVAQHTNVKLPRLSPREVLENYNCMIKKEGIPILTTTGVLFFAKNPQRFFPYIEIKAARFKGTKVGEFIDESRIKGTLPEMLDDAEKFVRKNTRKAMKVVEFERFEIPEYPYEAIREAIVNAIAHRDYPVTGATISVLIFDDRIEISSPGSLFGGLTIENMEGKHITRNSMICKLLYEIGEMEEYGTGIRKMKKMMRNYGLPEPDFEEEAGFFKVTFHGPGDKILELTPPNVKDRMMNLSYLNERQVNALKHIYEKGPITIKEYMKLFNVKEETASRELDELVTHKLAKRGRYRGKIRYISVE